MLEISCLTFVLDSGSTFRKCTAKKCLFCPKINIGKIKCFKTRGRLDFPTYQTGLLMENALESTSWKVLWRVPPGEYLLESTPWRVPCRVPPGEYAGEYLMESTLESTSWILRRRVSPGDYAGEYLISPVCYLITSRRREVVTLSYVEN